jgi:HD-GYP domain-containing protein (c-di-GMP phosphodiesterase class II)
VICIPEKSDVLPLTQVAPSDRKSPGPQKDPDMEKLLEVKRERIARLKKRREQDEQCERKFQKSVSAVKSVMRDIEAGSQEAFEESDQLMKSLVESLMPEKESAVQLMNTKFGKENVFFHSLNVSVLSMMLGAPKKACLMPTCSPCSSSASACTRRVRS